MADTVVVQANSPALGGVRLEAKGLELSSFGVPFQQDSYGVAELGQVEDMMDSNQNYLGTRLTLDGLDLDANTLNLDSATGEFRYYAEFLTGNAIGQRLPIVSNSETSVTLAEPPVGTLVAHFGTETGSKDIISVRPYWTLNDIEVSANRQMQSYDSSALSASRNGDAVIVSDLADPATTRFFRKYQGATDFWGELNADGILRTKDNSIELQNFEQAAIAPGRVWTVQLSGEESIDYYLTGVASSVQSWSLQIPDAGHILEIPFTLGQSEAIPLEDSPLTDLFIASASESSRTDELLVWKTETGYYRRVEKRFYLLLVGGESVWRMVGDDLSDQGDYLLQPGKGYLIRRRQ